MKEITHMKELQKQTILGNEFTIYGTVEEPLFRAMDVAKWIEHSNNRAMLDTVDDDEKVVRTVYTPGGAQDCWMLTENGVYEVLMLSRKPIAKQFKKEVKRILHDLRVNGTVVSTRVAMSSPEEQAESFQKALDSAVQHAIALAEAHFQPQLDQMRKEKCWISDRQTATAMQTASAATRRVRRLEREKEGLVERLNDLDDELDIARLDAERYRSWKSKVGRPSHRHVGGLDVDEWLF